MYKEAIHNMHINGKAAALFAIFFVVVNPLKEGKKRINNIIKTFDGPILNNLECPWMNSESTGFRRTWPGYADLINASTRIKVIFCVRRIGCR